MKSRLFLRPAGLSFSFTKLVTLNIITNQLFGWKMKTSCIIVVDRLYSRRREGRGRGRCQIFILDVNGANETDMAIVGGWCTFVAGFLPFGEVCVSPFLKRLEVMSCPVSAESGPWGLFAS
jgi:hypothetical protein